jgi:hypothetical protein
MLSHITADDTDVSRDKLFWGVALAMVAGQLLALWLLCSFQVRKAELRHAAAQAEQIALAEPPGQLNHANR